MFKLFNQTGRAIPDVSAEAVNFLIVDKGQLSAVSGTRYVTSISMLAAFRRLLVASPTESSPVH